MILCQPKELVILDKYQLICLTEKIFRVEGRSRKRKVSGARARRATCNLTLMGRERYSSWSQRRNLLFSDSQLQSLKWSWQNRSLKSGGGVSFVNLGRFLSEFVSRTRWDIKDMNLGETFWPCFGLFMDIFWHFMAIWTNGGPSWRPQKQACTERGYDFRWIHRLSMIY